MKKEALILNSTEVEMFQPRRAGHLLASCFFSCVLPGSSPVPVDAISGVLLGKVVLQHYRIGLIYLTREIICSWDSTKIGKIL